MKPSEELGLAVHRARKLGMPFETLCSEHFMYWFLEKRGVLIVRRKPKSKKVQWGIFSPNYPAQAAIESLK